MDAAFAVHNDMKSHTGGGISWGIGILLSMCQKQRLNAKSSTEAEVIGVSDFLSNKIWARMFLEKQGYEIDGNILYQDNQSTMKIEQNGSKSCSKRSRHIDVRYFFIKDRLESEKIEVLYCHMEYMVADFFTKPLQGKLFHYLKAIIMGHAPLSSFISKFCTKSQDSRVTLCPKSNQLNGSETDGKVGDEQRKVFFSPSVVEEKKRSYADAVREPRANGTGKHS